MDNKLIENDKDENENDKMGNKPRKLSLITVFFIVVIIVAILAVIFFNFVFKRDSEDDDKLDEVSKVKEEAQQIQEKIEKIEEESNGQFTAEIENKDKVFKADKYLYARGFAGASNYIYYMLNGNLYLLKYEEKDELIAENVLDIYYEAEKSDNIIVEIDKNSKINRTDISYLKFNMKGQSKFTVSTSYGDKTITADKYIKARGFAGASDYIYYMLNGDLYLLKYEGTDELIAENVLDIYYEAEKSDNIIVETDKNSILNRTDISYLKFTMK